MSRFACAALAFTFALGPLVGCKKSCETKPIAAYIAEKRLDPAIPQGDRDGLEQALSALAGEGKVCASQNGSPEIVFAKGSVATALTALEAKMEALGWQRKPGDVAKDGPAMVTYQKRFGAGFSAITRYVSFGIVPSKGMGCETGAVCIH